MTGVNGPQVQTTYSYNLDNARTLEATKTGGNVTIFTAYSYAATGILSDMETLKLTDAA